MGATYPPPPYYNYKDYLQHPKSAPDPPPPIQGTYMSQRLNLDPEIPRKPPPLVPFHSHGMAFLCINKFNNNFFQNSSGSSFSWQPRLLALQTKRRGNF